MAKPMIFNDLPELINITGQKSRLLGLDIGTKTIGLAICDERHQVASPLYTIKRSRFTADLDELIATIEEQEAVGLVIGLPLNTDGSEGPKCQSVRQFARNTLKSFEIPITFWDERFSTVAVTDTLLEADISRARRSELVDKMAAAYILQGAIDSIADDS